MDRVKNFVCHVIGWNNSGTASNKRKRSSEDTDNLVHDKNSLNSPLPTVKRARFDKGDYQTAANATDDSYQEEKTFWSRIFDTFRPYIGNMMTPKPIRQRLPDNDQQEDTNLTNNIETIDLVSSDDDNDSNVVVPSSLASSEASSSSAQRFGESLSLSSSTLSTLASFNGFTARNFSQEDTTLAVSNNVDMTRARPGPGHVITTRHEKLRKSQAYSPEAVKSQFKSGLQSRFDRFHSEKNIAKRVYHGGVSKPKSAGKKLMSNAFNYTKNLADRERYRQMLERFGVIKYSLITNRTEIVKSSSSPPNSSRKPGPVKANIDIITRVDDEVDSKNKMFTSTTIKESEPVLRVLDPKIDLAASPVLGRDKPTFKTPITEKPRPSFKSYLSENDDELSAAVDEVTSPKYLENLHNKYGAAARERDAQIAREKERIEKYSKETEEVCSMLDKRLETHLKITQAALPLEDSTKESEYDLSQPTEMPDMTQDMKAVVSKAKRSGGAVLVDAHKIQITVKDIDTLSGLNWLNDEIINFYMQMIVARADNNKENFRSVYAFSTFFYPRLMEAGYNSVKRWTKKVDLFSYSLVLVPVHLGMHWCLATIDMDKKSIVYYDSMGGNNKNCLRGLASYLSEEHKTKKGSELDMSGWSQVIAKEIPQQMNGSDCGMFTCKFAEYCSRRAKFTFGQKHMPYYRNRMVYEIVKNTLLHP